MDYIVGLDGGGTKTACILADSTGKILHERIGGQSTFLMIGTEKVSETIFNLLKESATALDIKITDIKSIVLGTTGAGRRNNAEKMETAFIDYAKSKGVSFKTFYVDSDARIALEGAFSGGPGSIIIAGTGSIMFGKDSKGIIHRVGGFGRFIGDQGSGYIIGRKGLVELSKYFDGRGLKTSLSELVANKFSITTPETLINEVYQNNFDIASVAPLVIETAEKGDEICGNILDEECDELILHIEAIKKILKENPLNVCLIGGIISTENYFAKMFKNKVAAKFSDVVIKQPDSPPAYGAVLMAKTKLC